MLYLVSPRLEVQIWQKRKIDGYMQATIIEVKWAKNIPTLMKKRAFDRSSDRTRLIKVSPGPLPGDQQPTRLLDLIIRDRTIQNKK